jgi:uncharacterized protein YcfJ
MKAKTSSKTTTLLALGALTLGTLGMSGCNNAGEGLFSGAALGAVTGLIIGSTTGNAGEGAAIGAAIGGAGGAIIGDQNERNRENAYIRSRNTHSHSNGHVRYERGYRTQRHYHYDEWWCD